MRRFGRTLAALTLAVGGFVGAVAGGVPASAGGGDKYDIVLVDLSGNEIPIIVNISPTLTATLCGVNISVINALTDEDDRAACPGKGTHHKAKKH